MSLLAMLFMLSTPRPMGPPAGPYHCLPGATKCGGLASLQPKAISKHDRIRVVLSAAIRS